MGITAIFSQADLVALTYFLASWICFNYLTDHSSLKEKSVSFHINQYRERWMHVMAERQLRMIDTSIMAGLQNGTAFFASTCLLAIGGCFALLGSVEDVERLYKDLPFVQTASAAVWEAKLLGLTAIFAYSFFKFGWTYRLFNYCTIVIGAVPSHEEEDSPERQALVRKAARLNVLGGKHFNLGLRGIFFSLGYIGWFLGPFIFMITTSLILVVVIRRQFFSAALSALKG